MFCDCCAAGNLHVVFHFPTLSMVAILLDRLLAGEDVVRLSIANYGTFTVRMKTPQTALTHVVINVNSESQSVRMINIWLEVEHLSCAYPV